MSYKPDQQDWMAFLYGELEGAEKEKIEQYILSNAEARLELEKFRHLRGMLGTVKDKEVIAPPIFVGDSKQRYFWSTPYFRTISSIAASLLVIMLVGKIVDLRIRTSNHELKISFGEQEEIKPANTAPASTLTAEQVQEMIKSSLNDNNIAMQASWQQSQQKLDASIKSNLAANSGKIDQLVREASTASQGQISQYVSGLREENLKMVKDYFSLTSNQQKDYIENLLVDFAKYLQQQRNDDLQVVQTRMNSLEQNTQVFKQETEQILTSIITTVGTTPTQETKY